MDRLDAMSMFLEIVDEGSLAAAARKLGRSPASVTRAVAQLEALAGERLLERTARHFSVNEAGMRHATIYRRILGELDQLTPIPSTPVISGKTVITAPELFGRLKVMPIVEGFLNDYPQTEVQSLFINRVIDIVGEGIDIAIRLAQLPDSSLTSIKVGGLRRLTCASPNYIAAAGTPEQPSDLQKHFCIGINGEGTQELWPYLERPLGNRVKSVRVNCRLVTNSAGAAIDAAERGLGIVRALSYQVETQLKHASLVPILEAYEPSVVPVSLVFRQESVRSNRSARKFIDFAVPQLRECLKDHWENSAIGLT